MSRHHHIHASEVSHVVNDITSMSAAEAKVVYGIEIRDDGSVYDPTYSREFETVGQWADFSFEQDEMEYTEEFGHGKQAHGDYY